MNCQDEREGILSEMRKGRTPEYPLGTPEPIIDNSKAQL